jgi:hypothetical protein
MKKVKINKLLLIIIIFFLAVFGGVIADRFYSIPFLDKFLPQRGRWV